MLNCCGKNRKTPFCPICGKSLIEPAEELLAELRRQLALVNPREAKYAKLIRWMRWIEDSMVGNAINVKVLTPLDIVQTPTESGG